LRWSSFLAGSESFFCGVSVAPEPLAIWNKKPEDLLRKNFESLFEDRYSAALEPSPGSFV
jgi:hypothetical protein